VVAPLAAEAAETEEGPVGLVEFEVDFDRGGDGVMAYAERDHGRFPLW
jgi:hypothetical protein